MDQGLIIDSGSIGFFIFIFAITALGLVFNQLVFNHIQIMAKIKSQKERE